MTISELIGNSNYVEARKRLITILKNEGLVVKEIGLKFNIDPGHPGLIGLVRMSRMLNIDLTCRVESDSENEWL